MPMTILIKKKWFFLGVHFVHLLHIEIIKIRLTKNS